MERKQKILLQRKIEKIKRECLKLPEDIAKDLYEKTQYLSKAIDDMEERNRKIERYNKPQKKPHFKE